MSITLRPIRPDDESFLLDVYSSTRAEEMALVPWTDEQKRAFIEMQFRAQDSYYRERFPNADFRVILEHEERVGRLYLLADSSAISIIDITVLPEHRKRGIGTFLIRQVIDEGSLSKRSVQVYVETHNPSLPLFERLGFFRVKEDGMNFLLECKPGTQNLGTGTSSAVQTIDD